MSVELTKRALIPALALIALLGAGCSDKGSQEGGEAAMDAAPAEEMAAPAESAEPAAAVEEAVTETAAAVEEAATEAAATVEAAATEVVAAAEEAVAEATGGADGKAIYDSSCQACHNMGIAGAPKLGDKEAWAPRIAKGNDALLESAKNGLNAMPPRGACATCSDDDLAAAIVYMVGQGS